MHSTTSLNQDVSKRYHSQLLNTNDTYSSEYIGHALVTSLIAAIQLFPLSDLLYVYLALYNCLIVVTLSLLFSFKVSTMFDGFT